MRSRRGSRPKIESDSVTEPAALPSSVVIFNSMSGSLRRLGVGRGGALAFGGSLVASCRVGFGQAELAGFRSFFGQRLFHGVAHGDPTALGTWHRTLDQDEPALDIGPHHLEIESGDTI